MAVLDMAGLLRALGIGEDAPKVVGGKDRLERGLGILSQYDVTGAGAKIGRDITGRAPPAEANPVLAPGFQEQVAQAGGTEAFAKQAAARAVLAPTPPAVDTVPQNAREISRIPAPAGSPRDILAAQAADSESGFAKLLSTNALVGAGGLGPDGGAGGTEAVNERIRGFGTNPRALEMFNEAQRLDRSGIQATRDANGQITFSSAPSATPRQYQAPDGSLTTNYNQSAQYREGVARAATDKAQLDAIERQRALETAQENVTNARTPKRLAAATEVLKSMLALEGQRGQTAVAVAAAQSKAGLDQSRLMLDFLKGKAEIGDKEASALIKQLTAGQGVRAIQEGQSAAEVSGILGQRGAQQPRMTVLPSLTGNDVITVDQTGRTPPLIQTPQRRISVQRDDKGAYVMEGNTKRYLKPDELARIK